MQRGLLVRVVVYWHFCIDACLYSCLCKSSLGTTWEIFEPRVLLNIWALTRIPIICPQLDHPIDVNKRVPFGARWTVLFNTTSTPCHVLTANRDKLDFMPSDQYI